MNWHSDFKLLEEKLKAKGYTRVRIWPAQEVCRVELWQRWSQGDTTVTSEILVMLETDEVKIFRQDKRTEASLLG